MPMTAEQRAKLEKLLGAKAKDVTDDNVVTVLLSYGETITDNFKKADEERTEFSKKVTTLSAAGGGTPIIDPEALLDRADNYEGKIELSMRDGDMPKFIAEKLKAHVKKDGKPNVFLLSRSEAIDGRPLDLVLGLFSGSKLGIAGGPKAPAQVLPRQTPGGKATNLSAADSGEPEGNPLMADLDAMYPDRK